MAINADKFTDIADPFGIFAVSYFIFIQRETILNELSGAYQKEFVNTLNACRLKIAKSPSTTKGSLLKKEFDYNEDEKDQEESEEERTEGLTN